MILLSNITKKFGETIIYKDTSYTFKDKSLTCFYGPSGSGKTTLFNMLAGFDIEYEGDIIVNDTLVNSLHGEELINYRFNNIGFVFQSYNLIKGYTALENVLMASNLNDEIGNKEKKERGLEILASLNLLSEANQRVETLSGGQKQRVAIGRALINNPSIILADEPTGALDNESSENIMNILKEISKEKTVVVITHDDEVLKYADEVITLEDNKIICVNENKEWKEERVKYPKWKRPLVSKKIINKLAIKNFRLNFFKYLLAAIIIAFSTSTFIASFNAKDIGEKLKSDFKGKNSFYNVGQIPKYFNGEIVNKDLDKIKSKLLNMDGVENVYYQYSINDINIKYLDKGVEIPFKVPTALPNESLSYGNMPKDNEKEIAISSSIANRLVNNIKDILGENIELQYKDNSGELKEVKLKVTGITNSSYQDFVVNSNIEKDIYTNINLKEENVEAISFSATNFEDVPEVEKKLRDEDITVLTKGDEIIAFLDTFLNLINLFKILSYIIMVVGLIVSSVLLYKVYSSREVEMAILSAIGYKIGYTKRIFFVESILLGGVSISLSILFSMLLNILSQKSLGYGLNLNVTNISLLILLNLFITLGLSFIITSRIIKKDKGLLLR
ncbi:ATP-binding cassette domain-containing protein [Clostridium perfringens]|nr:ATP-binding cassette domain-containing protein [Clostridium perfringens]